MYPCGHDHHHDVVLRGDVRLGKRTRSAQQAATASFEYRSARQRRSPTCCPARFQRRHEGRDCSAFRPPATSTRQDRRSQAAEDSHPGTATASTWAASSLRSDSHSCPAADGPSCHRKVAGKPQKTNPGHTPAARAARLPYKDHWDGLRPLPFHHATPSPWGLIPNASASGRGSNEPTYLGDSPELVRRTRG